MAVLFDLRVERVERAKAEGWWANDTVVDWLDHWAERQPGAVALVAYSEHFDSRTALTYGELRRLSLRIGARLRKLGMQAGDALSLQLPNWWEALPLVMGAVRIGMVVNPIPPILRRREVAMILSRIQPRIFVVPSVFRNFQYPDMARAIAADVAALEHIFVVGRDCPSGTSSFQGTFLETRWEEGTDLAAIEPRFRDPNEALQVMFTSGTTGEPKGVIHTHNTHACCWRAFRDVLRRGKDDVPLVSATLGHQTGYLIGLQMPIYLGQKVVYLDVWSPETAIPIIAREGVTWMHGSTPFLIGLTESPALNRHDLSRFRLFATGGAPVPSSLIDTARTRGIQAVSLWGMTENGATTMVSVDDPPWRSATSDGRAVPGSEVRIVDPETRCPAPIGSTGLLLSRGPSHFVGYLGRPDLYTQSHDDDGWFNTGDLARIDKDGYIRIDGRLKDLIIRGGENIPVLEIENVLYSHPKVREVAIVAMSDRTLGERACAYVICRDGPVLTMEEMQAYLAETGVTRQYWPERLEVVADFPRTATGKVEKYVLRQALAGKVDESSSRAAE